MPMHRLRDHIVFRQFLVSWRIVLTAGLFVALSISLAEASSNPIGCCPSRAEDQLWLVSDRGTGCCASAATVPLQYWRYQCGQGWVRSDLDSLLAAEDPQALTTVFVHGNRIPSCEAFTKGWTAYRALTRCAVERPVRFIIWSWPSDPVCGLVKDARVKAARTNPSGYHLAWFLDRLDAQAPVSLWGHSFGARIVTGAMHLLGGGELCGYRLSQRVHAERMPMQAVLLVAAIDNHWLLPGHFHGRALSQASEMLFVNNSCDALLKRYHVLYGKRCMVQAAGYMGLVTRGLAAEDRAKIRQLDACCQVGRRHLFAGYLACSSLLNPIRDTLLDGPPMIENPTGVVAAAEDSTQDAEHSQAAEIGG